jgi:hypothetical protein
MPSYPYTEEDGYPMTDENKAYLMTFNTRIVTPDPFRSWLRARRPLVSAVP